VQQADANARAAALFDRAVAVATADAHPPYATYDVRVAYTKAGKRTVQTWATTEDITHHIVDASTFSTEERASPSTPHGANIVARRHFAVSTPRSFDSSDPLPDDGANSPAINHDRGDPVGPVAFAVDQLCGLLPPRRYLLAHDDATLRAAEDDVATIGQTGTRAQRYRVTLLDDDGTVTHLALEPLRDPYRNRLRELWIETATAYVREAVVSGVGDRAPFDRTRWHVTFQRVEGGTYLADETALDPIAANGSLENLRIVFQHLTLQASAPLRISFGIATPVQTLHDP
jgi:hypothetical protein